MFIVHNVFPKKHKLLVTPKANQLQDYIMELQLMFHCPVHSSCCYIQTTLTLHRLITHTVLFPPPK